MPISTCTVIVKLTPKSGAHDRLLELRPLMTAEFERDQPGFVSATLFAVDGTEEWRDIVVFTDRASAESPIAGAAYDEWNTLVDVSGAEILDTLAEHVK